MGGLIKIAGVQEIGLVEIIFWRQAVALAVIILWAVFTGGIAMLATQRPKAHAVRSLYGLTGMACNFGAVLLLPLAEAMTISFSAPIFAVVLSVFLLSERVHIWRWGAVAMGFLGVVIITQPGGGSLPLLGALVGMGGAFMSALISIQVRDLTRTEHSLTIVFWFAVVTVICTAPLMFVYGEWHNPRDTALLIGIGLTGTAGQFLITLALRYGKVSSVTVMDYSGLIWATVLGWLLFSQLPTVTTWIGAPMVIGAGLVIAWREQVKARARVTGLHSSAGT